MCQIVTDSQRVAALGMVGPLLCLAIHRAKCSSQFFVLLASVP
jgi:hypothetical protein